MYGLTVSQIMERSFQNNDIQKQKTILTAKSWALKLLAAIFLKSTFIFYFNHHYFELITKETNNIQLPDKCVVNERNQYDISDSAKYLESTPQLYSGVLRLTKLY